MQTVVKVFVSSIGHVVERVLVSDHVILLCSNNTLIQVHRCVNTLREYREMYIGCCN